MNKSFCNSCRKLVPARRTDRDGKVYLVKDCPQCGMTETMISSDAARANSKRSLDVSHRYRGCELNCPQCGHADRPMYAFVDITNRCNLNCPICVDGVPGLGFNFEPPMEYFHKLFGRLAQFDPPPSIAFFGGEPTMREDLFEIIDLARSYGLRRRILTNGLKLADEQFCRRLIESDTMIIMSYDGKDPETYRLLRGRARAAELKLKAIENVGKIAQTTRAKLSLISCLGRGLNEDELPEIIELCHEHRGHLRDLYLMPLVPTWTLSELAYAPERTTTEDVENLLAGCFPGETVDFLPVGFVAESTTLAKYIGTAALAYRGAHPNCESVFLLVSNGERYLPITHFLKGSLTDLAKSFGRLNERLAAREKRWQEGRGFWGRLLGALRLRAAVLKLRATTGLLSALVRHLRLGRVFKGRGPGKLWHALAFLGGTVLGRRGAGSRHTNMHGVLQVIVLPLEDDSVVETERLERCPTTHAYYDPRDDKVKYCPVCAWRLHNKTILRGLADYYAAHAPSAP